jgi:glycolate oxidase iron-sulfur subunit
MSALDDLAAKCIRCGFCLESCPTFTETGEETESPRGRIYLVRSAEAGLLDWKRDVAPHLDLCLGCRACETACPSGVEYGSILESARARLEEVRKQPAIRGLLKGITTPWLLRYQLFLGRLWPGRRIPRFVGRRFSKQKPEADRPRAQEPSAWPALDESKLPPVKGEVYLLEGCAMRVLYPRVHAATRRLLRRVGYAVREVDQGCCGALHAHQGFAEEAREKADSLARALPENLPLVVDSAGCGSFLKEHAPESLRGRVVDISEFLFREGLVAVLAGSGARGFGGSGMRVTYHDACHLRHGQKVFEEPRALLRAVPELSLIELEEADTCCGSAGIYNLTEPAMARRLLERKMAHIESTGAEVVVLGNPGCHAWIAQGAREHGKRVRVLHTAEVLESALSELD